MDLVFEGPEGDAIATVYFPSMEEEEEEEEGQEEHEQEEEDIPEEESLVQVPRDDELPRGDDHDHVMDMEDESL